SREPFHPASPAVGDEHVVGRFDVAQECVDTTPYPVWAVFERDVEHGSLRAGDIAEHGRSGCDAEREVEGEPALAVFGSPRQHGDPSMGHDPVGSETRWTGPPSQEGSDVLDVAI